ncbi:MAG TPA: response regulator receiver protein [Pseudolabrys sp.]|nr:response regulator receiver protein [Pseudolabrys sp.]
MATGTNTKVLVVTADPAFAAAVRSTFGASRAIDLAVVEGSIAAHAETLDVGDATVIVADLDDAAPGQMAGLARLAGRPTPVIAVTQAFDANVARVLLQMRIADLLVKPVQPLDLVRACAQASKAPSGGVEATEAKIYTFLPAVGGAGVTTLAVQAAMLLLNARGPRAKTSTCLVDLDFQHGAVADYLDIEPRLNIAEIEPRPDRLDRQLLEVMLSYHDSGLAVVAAPNRPAEMRSFDPDVVTRLLDLVSSHFEYVVFDMPRTWFSWTDSVLLGSNRLYIVSEATVPGLRHAKQLVAAIKERLGEGPKAEVVINRFQQRMFSSALALKDIEQTIGEAFCSAIPNDYQLVREAIDRGVPLDDVKPGNKITAQLKKLVLDRPGNLAAGKPLPLLKKLKLAGAR